MDEEQKVPEQKSFIYILFEELESTKFSWHVNLVSPMQMLMLASYLELMAKNTLAQQMNIEAQRKAMEEARKIVKPGETGIVSGDEARALWGTLGK